MDKRFPEGSFLYCNRYNKEDDRLPIAEYVIVVRQDTASDELEATCKRLEKHESLPDAYVLQPESSNRNHTRMLLESTDDERCGSTRLWLAHSLSSNGYHLQFRR